MSTAHPDPRDGFRAVLVHTRQPESEAASELLVTFYIGGAPAAFPNSPVRPVQELIARYAEPLTPFEESERLRAFYLFEAFCRYLNTGGSARNFRYYADRMVRIVAESPSLDLSAWTYHATGPVQTPVDHGVWEGHMRFGHTFVPKSADSNAQALYWEEPDGSDGLVGGLIELFPVKELEDEVS